MLAFSFATESMNIPLSREEEDSENMYIDDFFWLHERGVDLLELFLFIHLLRKLYLNVADVEQEVAWKSGALLFLLLQGVVFTGLVLCCTHLSDITLVIASNIVHTLCLFTGKLYWLFFTDQTLNIDTVTRLAYAHFVLGIFVSLLSIYHGIDMHYDWKTDGEYDALRQEINWFDEALVSEIGQTIEFLLVLGLLCLYLFSEPSKSIVIIVYSQDCEATALGFRRNLLADCENKDVQLLVYDNGFAIYDTNRRILERAQTIVFVCSK